VTSVDGQSGVPGEFSLDQNFPNPFNPSTQIRFMIPHEGQVKLSVFDLLGQEIRVLLHGSLRAGPHALAWDGRDASGEAAPSGVYFYRLTHEDRQITRKLLLLR
jgi:flagellar hook assembly protein FlgD